MATDLTGACCPDPGIPRIAWSLAFICERSVTRRCTSIHRPKLRHAVPGQDGDPEPHWVLFNDFLVRRVAGSEVFSFVDMWKVPAVIVLQRKDAEEVLDLAKLPSQIKPDVLFKDVSLAW